MTKTKTLTATFVTVAGLSTGSWAADDCPSAKYNLKGEWFNPIQTGQPVNEFQLSFDALDRGTYGCYWVRTMNGLQDTQPGEVFLAFIAGQTEDNIQILIAAPDGHWKTQDGVASIREDSFIYAMRLSRNGLTSDTFSSAGIGLRSRGRPRSRKVAE